MLFAKKKIEKKPNLPEKVAAEEQSSLLVTQSATADGRMDGDTVKSFAQLGLFDWICKSVARMGFRRPTEIQTVTIPSILEGKDVIGCAETGSGKTAAFALPILQDLSKDPFGIFAVVLTPTRELAIQIEEQFAVFGQNIGLKTALVIGGSSMTEQSLALFRQPHIVIATPGRLRCHLESSSADPPNLTRARYIVLDEADRLLSAGFSAELQVILGAMSHPNRRTLLFSATMTSSLSDLQQLAMAENTLIFNLTTTQKMPTSIRQQYLLVPGNMKMVFLVAVLREYIFSVQDKIQQQEERTVQDGINADSRHQTTKLSKSALAILRECNLEKEYSRYIDSATHTTQTTKKERSKAKGTGAAARTGPTSGEDSRSLFLPTSSVMVFVSSCAKCEEICQLLVQIGVNAVSLHSLLPQSIRSAHLAAFKSHHARVLVSTDVASRGLDIPSVELVVNVDLPRILNDYVHRVGRTGRAGNFGRSISFVTPADVELVQQIEEFIGIKLTLFDEVNEETVIPLLNPVSKAVKEVQLKLLEKGFDELVEERAAKKKKKRKLEP